MNYDRRFSPGANPDYSNRTMNYRDSRSQQITPRGGIESRANAYGREYPPLRSRSQTNMDQDYGDRFSQQQPFYDNRGLDTKSRSKSLDNREFHGGGYDDGFYRNEYSNQEGGVVIPIRRDIGRDAQYDYRSSPQTRHREVEPYGIDDRRPPVGQEVHIPYNRDIREGPPMSREPMREPIEPLPKYFPPRRSFDGRMGDSPKSYSSRFKEHSTRRDFGRGPGFGDDFEREDYGAVQPYRGPPVVASGGGGGGGYRSSSYHRSHHESYGGGGGGHEFGTSRGAITQQPGVFHQDMRPVRPIQHHRVQCCCFKFVWPPWSYENAPPPQPIYRNI
ncbi:hypothetical protein L3Y34_010861 [Caenorhabditis briggsae]|uniref:Uncharacterized protein n=1 Tax=Caenorhabditis briggsae TaxID=6238 RepID=A0AAE9CTN6_CAEBR|nr:hypothetical protein L3Y34_010861 [Caenorhabditis briggsae]